jgi:hypothetical protein
MNRKIIIAIWLVTFGVSVGSFAHKLFCGHFDMERLNTILLIGFLIILQKQLMDMEEL